MKVVNELFFMNILGKFFGIKNVKELKVKRTYLKGELVVDENFNLYRVKKDLLTSSNLPTKDFELFIDKSSKNWQKLYSNNSKPEEKKSEISISINDIFNDFEELLFVLYSENDNRTGIFKISKQELNVLNGTLKIKIFSSENSGGYVIYTWLDLTNFLNRNIKINTDNMKYGYCKALYWR